MLRSAPSLVLPALQSRLVLLVNHVLSREPIAMQRLKPHASRLIRIEAHATPAWLPALPAGLVRITPAGLFELEDGGVASPLPDLQLRLVMPDAGQALAALAGDVAPRVQIEGDAALAADIHWLVDNLRWDVEADLAEAIGPVMAHQVVKTGRAVAAALRSLVPAAPSLGAERR
jgi:ubiquinone biosynthesis protein UbiJ